MSTKLERVIWERGSEGLDRGHEGLGIHIQGGQDFPLFKIVGLSDPGIFIAHLNDGGVAQKDGRLKVGDKIVSVNGVNVESVTREEFVRLFADAAKERLVIEVIPDAAAKILSDHESPRNSMDGDHGSLMALESPNPGQDGETQGQYQEKNSFGKSRGQAPTLFRSPAPTPPLDSHSTSPHPTSPQSTSHPQNSPSSPVSARTSPSASLTSGVDDLDDLESMTSLVSNEEMPPPRPKSSLDKVKFFQEVETGRPFELQGCFEKSFVALERVEEVEDENDLWNSPSACSQLTLADDDVVDDDDDDDPGTEIMLDAVCQVDHCSSSGSLDSDSDEELRRCRESVCPESHEGTPISSPVYFTIEEGLSPTKTDDSSRNSSSTPDTVVARSTWLASRTTTPARSLLSAKPVLAVSPLPELVATPFSDSGRVLHSSDDADHAGSRSEQQSIYEQLHAKEQHPENRATERAPSAAKDATSSVLVNVSTSSAASKTSVRSESILEVMAKPAQTKLPVFEEEVSESEASSLHQSVVEEYQQQEQPQQPMEEAPPPRYPSPESPAELAAISQRLILEEEEMLSVDKEEKNRDWASSAKFVACFGGVVALAAFLIAKQIRTNHVLS